ncbi:MAG TPA: LapA family protein [Burkholderiaceae bacterium]|nr:LapA family protein [Burkholderiaceae bacterium]
MRYLVWILRLLVFVVILMFALKNTGPVNVGFFGDYVVSGVPLIVVMLVMLVLGAVLGWFITLPSLLRYRREVARLKREKSQLQEKLERVSTPAAEPAAPATVAPVAPL